MGYYFLLIQVIGGIAFLFLAFSYYRKNTNQILFFQIVSCILYCIHYYLLGIYDSGAYSGLVICIFETVMDYLYYKTDWDNKLFLISIPFYLICGIFSYHVILDLFSIFASLTDRYSLTRSRKFVVLGGFIAYILWLIYDFHVQSISGVITDAIIVCSNLYILLYEFHILKGKKKEIKFLSR